MEYGFLSRAGRFLQEQKKHRRWMVIFLCLAAGVTLGTLGFLKLYGQAMTHRVRVLNCKYEVHVHTDECYIEDEDGEEILVCEHADEAEYVIHVHNDDCYNDKGELVCLLEEHEAHEHTDDCWEEREVLVCELEETEDIVSTETVPAADAEADTQTAEQPAAAPQTELIQTCGKEEHEHTDDCYPISCGLDEHAHDRSCMTQELICGLEEHSHGEECYDEEGNLTCEAEHTHEDSCYEEVISCELEEHVHDDSCRPADPSCGLEAHIHDDGCYEEQIIETTEPVQPAVEVEEPVAPVQTVITEGHVHTDECYETVWELTCGELELHTHEEDPGSEYCCYDEDCYDEDGNFIEGSRPSCGLLQLEEHIHTEDEEDPENSCFDILELTDEEVAALNNGATLHVHTDDCYDEDGNLICGHEVTHLHQLDCYDEDGHLICGFGGEPHEHDAGCYDEEGNLTCGFENAEDHEHDAGCYDEEGNLTCGYEGMKDHEHSQDCYDEEGNLICGHEGMKDHEHDADCYDIFGNLICGYEGMADHAHTEDCYDEEGNLICGREIREVYEQSKSFENDSYIVVARYNNDAEIPEEAEFIAEQITAESDTEHYASRESEYRSELKDDTASMRALLKVGFYVGEEEERKEVEPVTPVEIAVQFLDEDGLAEGRPITIIHFAEEGVERLDGSKAKNNSTSFKMNSFSEIAIGYSPEERTEVSEDGIERLHLSDSFEYEDNAFHITFRVEGDAVLQGNADKKNDVREPETEENEIDISNNITSVEESGDMISEAEEKTDAEETEDIIRSEAEEDAEDEVLTDAVDEAERKELKFTVVSLSEMTDEYRSFAEYKENQEGPEDLVRRQILACSMSYGDAELDLSECQITAEVSMVKALESKVEESIPDAVAYLQNSNDVVLNQTENIQTVLTVSEDNEPAGPESMSDPTNDVKEDEEGKSLSSGTDLEKDDDSEKERDVLSADQEDAAAAETGSETDIYVSFYDIAEDGQVVQQNKAVVNEETRYQTVKVRMSGVMLASEVESVANVHFNVEYYAMLSTVARAEEVTGSQKKLTVIDTSGVGNGSGEGNPVLPANGVTPETTNIHLTSNGDVITNEELEPIEIYKKDTNISYFEQPNLSYFNKLRDNGNYVLDRVEVGMESEDGAFTSDQVKIVPTKTTADGSVVPDIDAIHFTNKPETKQKYDDYLLIREGAVVRLIYRTTSENDIKHDAEFYDYDISDGTVRTDGNAKIIKTGAEGINSTENCAEDVKYAFGNDNAGTNYGKKNWEGNELNKYNNNGFSGCTFGLVSVKMEEGKDNEVNFNVPAPKIFGDVEQTGKTLQPGHQLVFNRSGDTYTLTSVTGTSTTDLEKFVNTAKDIWSNNFWPMDSASTWGVSGHDMKFGNAANKDNLRYEPGKNKWFGLPAGDDGLDHNSYFGMYYSVDFELVEDYIGPLEYIFFGDDDMWVYLDGKLVCDIGGVHSSVGEYVNLWDYLRNPDGTLKDGADGAHTLKFFYTERGASGSSCWMQFTLPSVTENHVLDERGSMKISKAVADKKTGNALDTDEEFEFRIVLKEATDDYSYTKYDANGKELMKDVIVWDGADFTLRNGEYIEVSYLPIGMEFEITEKEKEGDNYYYTEIIVDGEQQRTDAETTTPKTAYGTITSAGSTVQVSYRNLLYIFELPETGGYGTNIYTVAGAFCLIFGAGFMYRKKFRGRRV